MTHDPSAIPDESFAALHAQRIAEMQSRYAMLAPPPVKKRGPYVKLPPEVRKAIFARCAARATAMRKAVRT